MNKDDHFAMPVSEDVAAGKEPKTEKSKSCAQSFRRVAADAGLKDVTPHTLRHTAATWMAQAGVPLWVIAKYLGHSSSRTTEKIYAHHNPSFLLEAKQALEKRPEVRKPVSSSNLSKLAF